MKAIVCYWALKAIYEPIFPLGHQGRQQTHTVLDTVFESFCLDQPQLNIDLHMESHLSYTCSIPLMIYCTGDGSHAIMQRSLAGKLQEKIRQNKL